MDINLKVQPEVLLSKANELSTEKNAIIVQMDQSKTEINSLVGSWKSDSSDEFQTKFKQVYDDIDNMIAIMSEYISDMNEIANIYKTAEATAKNNNESLPTDGVFRV